MECLPWLLEALLDAGPPDGAFGFWVAAFAGGCFGFWREEAA